MLPFEVFESRRIGIFLIIQKPHRADYNFCFYAFRLFCMMRRRSLYFPFPNIPFLIPFSLINHLPDF